MPRVRVHMEPPPSLEQLCLQTAIDNLHRFGDVGDTDLELLRVILPHCTTDQLMHIEDCTKRDLTSVTSDLWKKSYGRDFGKESLEAVVTKLKARKARFKWRELYEAKKKSLEEKQKKGVELLRELCAEENNKKQSRRIQLCTKLPPEPKRRWSSGPSSSFSHVKGRLMKKARVEHASCGETRMMTSIKKQQEARLAAGAKRS